MLKRGEEDKVVLIDFDWPEKWGEVRYPITRCNGFAYPVGPLVYRMIVVIVPISVNRTLVTSLVAYVANSGIITSIPRMYLDIPFRISIDSLFFRLLCPDTTCQGWRGECFYSNT